MTEITRYFSVETRSDMLVDIAPRSDKLNVNIDIIFRKLPCEIISLDVQNVLGGHEVDIKGSLVKRRLSQQGDVLSETFVQHGQYDRGGMAHDALEQIKNKEGCQL